MGYVAVGIDNCAILSHSHNGHREIHAQRVNIEETKEGQKHHDVSLLAPESPCQWFTLDKLVARWVGAKKNMNS